MGENGGTGQNLVWKGVPASSEAVLEAVVPPLSYPIPSLNLPSLVYLKLPQVFLLAT